MIRKSVDSLMWAITAAAPSSLQNLFEKHWRSQCSDPRDKVYAIRALATDNKEAELSPKLRQKTF